MKTSKIMLAVIAMFLITWLVIGTIAYLLNDMSYKHTLSHPLLWFVMAVVGWIPSAIVGDELNSTLK